MTLSRIPISAQHVPGYPPQLHTTSARMVISAPQYTCQDTHISPDDTCQDTISALYDTCQDTHLSPTKHLLGYLSQPHTTCQDNHFSPTQHMPIYPSQPHTTYARITPQDTCLSSTYGARNLVSVPNNVPGYPSQLHITCQDTRLSSI